MMRVSYLVLVVLLVGAGCRSVGDPTEDLLVTTDSVPSHTTLATAPVGDWAWEAEEFAELLTESDPGYATQFYAPTAVIEVPYRAEPGGDYVRGRDAIFQFKDRNMDQVVHQVFVGQDRIALLLYPKLFIAGQVPELVVCEIDNGLVAHETHAREAEELRTWAISSTADDRLHSLYEAYISARRDGDSGDIGALYRSDARRTDGLLGGVWRPASASAATPPPTETFLSEPQHYTSYDAIFTPGEAESSTDPARAHALFEVFVYDGCRFQMLAIWELEDFQIADELLLYEVSSSRACEPYLEVPLPNGWWTGWKRPERITETVTGQVSSPDGSGVEIINGSPRKEGLVRWGLSRFETMGLALPRVATIAFPPTASCQQHGVHTATLQPDTARIDVCLRDFEICADETCEPYHLPARFAVLHELGHAWVDQNVGDHTQTSFLELRALKAWSDPEAVADQGVEQAAETIAWGLMDIPDPPIRIEDATGEQLAAAYRLLTGVDPFPTAVP